MAYQVLIHVHNEDAVLCELDELPGPQDRLIATRNPRHRDGTPVHYINEDALYVYYPIHRITLIQIMPLYADEPEE